jgi:hypothetical protein
MKRLLTLLFFTAFLFTACEETIIDTNDDDPGQDPVSHEITSEITSDMTFSGDETYVIDGLIRVRNATLTFEPGTRIEFINNGGFEFAYWDDEYATMIAKGTIEEPIVFTSGKSDPSNGDWLGIAFYKGAVNCELDFCIIEYAGANQTAMSIEDCEVSISNSVFRNSGSKGIVLRSGAQLKDFDSNTFENIASYVIEANIQNVGTITGTNFYQTEMGILINDDKDLDQLGDYTINHQGISYFQDGTIRFGTEGAGNTFTVEAGVEVLFMEGARWDIGYWDDHYVSLKILGTSKDEVHFGSAAMSPKPGDWDGLFFYKPSYDCVIQHAKIEYGGSNYYGMITVEETEIDINNSEIANSSNYGVYMSDGASFSNFNLNVFKDNNTYSIYIYPSYVHSISGNNVYHDSQGILISDDKEFDIAGDYVWTNQETPYVIEGNIRIGALGNGVNLEIEEGTELRFHDNGQFDISYWSDYSCSLKALGSADKPIIFTSNSMSPSNNDWDGLKFYDGSHDCILSNVIIEYAGGEDTPWGAITLTDAGMPLVLENMTIQNISNHGISVDDESSVDYSSVTFININGENYHVR